MRITTCYLCNFDILQKFYQSRSWLIRITFYIGGQIFHRLKTELSAGTCSPRINITFDVDRNCMSITSSNLINALVSQLLYFEWIRLKWVAFSVLGHFSDYLTRVSKLSHFSWAPSIEVPFFGVVHLIVVLIKFVLLLLILLVELRNQRRVRIHQSAVGVRGGIDLAHKCFALWAYIICVLGVIHLIVWLCRNLTRLPWLHITLQIIFRDIIDLVFKKQHAYFKINKNSKDHLNWR